MAILLPWFCSQISAIKVPSLFFMLSVSFLAFDLTLQNLEMKSVLFSTAEGVEVDCGQDEMTITLPKSLLLGLDREHLRLIDPECTATENETHFFLQTKTDECGTILKHTKDHAIYSNMVSEIPIKENQIVTRVRDAMIPFHCYYSKWGVVSSIGIRPSSTKIVLSSKGFGKFTLSLDLFRSPE